MSEEENRSFDEGEIKWRISNRGGRILRFEPRNTNELMASPMIVTYFKNIGCFEFYEKVQKVQHHPILTRVFISNLHDNQVTHAGVTFTMSTAIILATIGIPDVGEKWFKQTHLEEHYYEPYIKPRYRNDRKRLFPFSDLLDRYVPMMKIIMTYFTYEGRFSRLYTYHIRLLINFTRVNMLNIPYYLFRSIDKMTYIVQKREYEHQMRSIFHHSLIKIIVLHHLKQLNIPWSAFIANEIFTDPFIQHVQDVPSSFHPSTSIPPYQPIDHASSSYHSPSPSPPPSPFHEHIESPNRDEISEPK